MPKLSDINVDKPNFSGHGLRPWSKTTSTKNVKKKKYTEKKHNISVSKGHSKGVQEEGTNKGYTKGVQEEGTNKGYTKGVQEEGTNKGYTKGVQERGTEKGYNGVQKKGTIEKRVHNKGTEKGYNGVQKRGTNTETECADREHIISTKFDQLSYRHSYQKLSGTPKIFVDVIYSICKETQQERTPPITLENLAKLCNSNKNTVKVTRKRLLKIGLIITEHAPSSAKIGRASELTYSLPKSVFDEIKNTPENSLFGVQKEGTERGYITSLSSSYNNTTTGENMLSKEWQKISIELLEDIGFSERHLIQIANKKLNTPEIVQESINHFAYGLTNKKKEFNSDPLNVLMGVLRKGGVWIESGYKSSQELAMEKIIKSRESERERVAALQKESDKLDFKDWLDGLTEEMRVELLKDFKNPVISRKNPAMAERARESFLRDYYDKNVKG